MSATLEATPIVASSSSFVPKELEGIPDPVLEMIRPSELTLDADINRALDHAFVDKLARDFNKHALGALSAWRRSDDEAPIILDGQHRKVTCELVGYDDPRPTLVYTGITLAQSAELFLALNKTRNVHAVDKFRKALQAEHPNETTVARVLAEFGLEIGWGPDDSTAAGAMLSALALNGEDGLRSILETLQTAYREKYAVHAFNKDVVAAVSRVEKRYRKSENPLDFEILGEAFGTIELEQLEFDRNSAARQNPKFRVSWHYCGVIVKLYNATAPRSKRLTPDWFYSGKS